VPIGNKKLGEASGPHVGLRTATGAIFGAPNLSPGGPITSGDLWQHYIISAADMADDAQQITLDSQAERIVVLERSGIAVFIGLDGPASKDSYDLIHPGSGLLDFQIPPTNVVNFALDPAGASPTTALDVWLLGGSFIHRP
jgi:hypothetical protein